MTTDLTITTDGELMVSHVEAETDAGTDFVDSYCAVAEIVVVDSGRIIIPQAAADGLAVDAEKQGLAIEWEKGL